MLRRTLHRVCAFLALALAPAAHAGSPYEAFRFPDVHSQQFFVSGQYSSHSARTAQLNTSQRNYSSSESFLLSGDRLDETDRHARSLSLSTRPLWSLALDRAGGDFAPTINSVRFDSEISNLQSAFRWSESWFTPDSRWGIESELTAVHLYSRAAQEFASSTLNPPSEAISTNSFRAHAYLASGEWTIGLGHGRVRDVTGVLQAAAFEERLDRYGRLAHPLSDAARLRLAQWFARGERVDAVHEQPSKVFWREVARIVREDGALKNGELDAEALERVQEDIAPSTPFSLRRGTRVSALVELSRDGGHQDLYNRQGLTNLDGGVVISSVAIENSAQSRSDHRRSRVGVDLETSHPAGLLTQWTLGCRVLTGDGPARSIEMQTDATVQRLLLDRLYGLAAMSHRTFVTKDGEDYSQPNWQLNLFGILSYRIEDHWSVDLRVQHFDATTRANRIFVPVPGFVSTDQSNTLAIGLTWRPSGRFDSPTLGIHERPMAMAR